MKIPEVNRRGDGKVIWTRELDQCLRDMHANGVPQREVARLLHMSTATIFRRENALGLKRKRDYKSVWDPKPGQAPYKTQKKVRKVAAKVSNLAPIKRPVYDPEQTEPIYREGALDFLKVPSRMGNKLVYRGGRVEDAK